VVVEILGGEILGGSVSEEAAALRSLVGSLVPRPSLRARLHHQPARTHLNHATRPRDCARLPGRLVPSAMAAAEQWRAIREALEQHSFERLESLVRAANGCQLEGAVLRLTLRRGEFEAASFIARTFRL